MKILLVDKCPLFREGVIHLLRCIDPDAEIIEAGGYGQVLLRAEHQRDIELLLLGLAWPRQHGLQALTDVRARLPNATIIVLAEFERFDDIRDTLENGADSYIARSCSIETMSSAIKLLMAGGVYFSPLLARRQHGASDIASSEWRRHGDRRMAHSRSSVRLTKRQQEVLQLVMQGMTNKRIGRVLTISDKTVKTHVTTILRFLNASNRTEAGMLAAKLGLTPISTSSSENLRVICKASQSDSNNETSARTAARWLRKRSTTTHA